MKNMYRKDRGSILILASLFTFLTLLLAFTLFKVLPVEYNAAQKSRIDIAGHYAIDAGVKDAVAWIESRPQGTEINETALAEFNAAFGGVNELVNNWTYSVNIELIEVGHYGVTSEAFFRGEKVREAKVQLIREGFAQYALFIDHWQNEDAPAGSALPVYFMGENQLTGPFHTNDFFVLGHKTDNYFDDGGASFVSGPFARMTHAGATDILGDGVPGESDGNAYVTEADPTNYNTSADTVPYNEDGAIEQRYQRVVEGGRGNLGKVAPIFFPNTAQDNMGVDLREKARGDIPFTGILDRGVYLATSESFETTGGVYVVGNSDVELTLDANGNQVQKILQEHIENAYFEVEEVEVERPRYVPEEVTTPPEFVNEVIIVPETQLVIVGYNEDVIVAGDGITTTVQTPIYEEQIVDVPQVVSVPYDPELHGLGPWTIYVEDEDNPIVYTTSILNQIPEEEYDPEIHIIQPQPAGDRLYEVVEVTEDAGYQVPAGFTIEGVGGANVPKDHTVFLDHEELKAVVSSGNLNGVLFVDGNIDSFKGTTKGAVTDGPDGHTYSGRTVVAAPELGKNIQITGDLLRFYNGGGDIQGPNKTLKPGEIPSNDAHSLGLIGHDVEINVGYQTNDTNPLNLYAVILAGSGKYDPSGNPILDSDGRHIVSGGFGANPSRLDTNPLLVGRFHLYGGLIEGNARPWFEAPNGVDLEGYEGTLIYDPAAVGLQNFPATYTTKVVRYSEYTDYD